ncbi:hypothetical protein ACGFZJ_34940 [Streptomyces sp. NPDC048253]|uniref:hypothetical protein n=1 Tax=Streptomyces sp. NPDC048253 TaxID=3365524 RepID=UPI003718812F
MSDQQMPPVQLHQTLLQASPDFRGIAAGYDKTASSYEAATGRASLPALGKIGLRMDPGLVTYVDPESRAKAEAHGHPYASEEIIAAGYDLASRVCRELRRAGLPADVVRPGVAIQPGVWVEVDSQGEYAGGLYVRWSAPELGEAGLRAVAERKDPAAPEWKRYAEVVLLMQTALIGILRLAGFSASQAEEINDVAEGDVYVHADTPSSS